MVLNASRKRLTAHEFEEFVLLPENAERRFELIAGEVVEMVSNSYSSIVALRIAIRLGIFIEENNLGWETGADGGYIIGSERYIPDVGFISIKRHPEPPQETYIQLPPDLAVEVLSPSDEPEKTRRKIGAYLIAGTTVWVVNPADKYIEVYAPGQELTIYEGDDVIDGSPVLPGFTLKLADVFPEATA